MNHGALGWSISLVSVSLRCVELSATESQRHRWLLVVVYIQRMLQRAG